MFAPPPRWQKGDALRERRRALALLPPPARVRGLMTQTRSKRKMLSLQSFLRKGVSLGYVRMN